MGPALIIYVWWTLTLIFHGGVVGNSFSFFHIDNLINKLFFSILRKLNKFNFYWFKTTTCVFNIKWTINSKNPNSYCLKRLLGRGQLDYIKQISFKFWPGLLPTHITQYINLLITCSKLQKLLLFWCLKIFSTIQQTTGSVLLLLL